MSSQASTSAIGLLAALVFAGQGSLPAQIKPVWQERNGHRFFQIQPQGSGAGFRLMSNSTLGIRFTNTLSYERSMMNQNLLNGAGVAVGDFDQDGLSDLYFCNLQGPNALYRNLGGWKFENVTERAGVACTNQASTGAVFADVNGDGKLDLLVTSCGGPNALFINRGEGVFTNVTAQAGLLSKAGSTTMALADIDRDGDLDLYVANYGETSILRTGGALTVRMVNGKPVVGGRYANRVKIINGMMYELGEPDLLYRNDGQGKFSAVSWTDGNFLDEEGKPLTAVPWDMGLSAMFYDINQDGAPDLYVCNDFQTPDRCWINNGRGVFRAIDRNALGQTSHFSMGVDFADLNRDGRVDFFVADMLSRSHQLLMTQMGVTNALPHSAGETGVRPQIRRNTLFLGRSDQSFAEIANYAGLEASEWTWSAVFLDVDLDGYEDLLIGNGHAYDTQDLDTMEAVKKLGKQTPAESRQNLKRYPLLQTPNLAFRNRGDLTFEERGSTWGFHSTQVTHGIAQGDFDNDGDLDLALNCLNAPPLIYRNEAGAPRIAVRLLADGETNRYGIGAHLKLSGGNLDQNQQMICGGRYLSGDEALRVFAAPKGSFDLEVTWPDGTRDLVAAIAPNTLWEIRKGKSPATGKDQPLVEEPLFAERTDRLNHSHQEDSLDELAGQPLLPRLLGKSGPSLGWIDLNQDGLEDLVAGSGAGGKLTAFLSSRQGAFTRVEAMESAPSDLTGFARAAGPVFLAGMGGLENVASNGLLEFSLNGDRLESKKRIPSTPSSHGPVAVADIDRDGDLDIFLGGQSIPHRYPQAGPSQLWRAETNRYVPAQTNLFQGAGLVNGAVFADFNNDGWPDLLLAVEWSALKLFLNRSGEFEDQTAAWGLDRFEGWWNSVAVGDFNHDGQIDMVAGNWGLNSNVRATAKEPALLYSGDLDGNGSFDLVEAFRDRSGKIFPRRDLLSFRAAFPFFQQKNITHRDFGASTVAQLFGDRLARSRTNQVTDLATRVFLNRSSRFESVDLPAEAQFAPVFGITVADFDNDGTEDVFLGQNFYQLRPELPRLDGGRGLLLRGKGDGTFSAEDGNRSGIKIYGEQRGSAAGDFNGDGRMDLAVGQNGGPTLLYENVGSPAGVRVRLQGPPANPAALGSRVQWYCPGERALVRTLTGGSGYRSQEGLVLVFPKKSRVCTLSIRWPDGHETESKIKPEDTEVKVAR